MPNITEREQQEAFIETLRKAQYYYHNSLHAQAGELYNSITTALIEQEALFGFKKILPVCQSYVATCHLKTIDSFDAFNSDFFTDLTMFSDELLDIDNLDALMQLRFEMIKTLLKLYQRFSSRAELISATETIIDNNQKIIDTSRSMHKEKLSDDGYFSYKILNTSYLADIKCIWDKKNEARDVYRSLANDYMSSNITDVSDQVVELTCSALVHYVLLSIELSSYDEITIDIKSFLLKHKNTTAPKLGVWKVPLLEVCKMFEQENYDMRLDSTSSQSVPSKAILHLQYAQVNESVDASKEEVEETISSKPSKKP